MGAFMKIEKILSLLEHKPWTANQYARKWNPSAGKHGLWSYEHRDKLGLTNKDSEYVVHHKDGDIHNNKKSNLEAISRAEHARVGKPALKHEKCRICGEPHFAKGLCRHHYYKKYKK